MKRNHFILIYVEHLNINVKNYIILQNQISNQSSTFANVWQKVLLENHKTMQKSPKCATMSLNGSRIEPMCSQEVIHAFKLLGLHD